MRRSQQAAIAKSAANRPAFHDGKSWHWQRFERSEIDFHLRLIVDALLGRGEFLELGNIGTGNEGLAADAAQDRYADIGIAAELFAGRCQALIHSPRHGVARLRPVEQNCRHCTVAHQTHFTVIHWPDAPLLQGPFEEDITRHFKD